MGKVVYFDDVTRLDLPPDRILEQATGELESVVVMGYSKDGEEVFRSSIADGADVLWLMKRLERKLLSMPDNDGL